VRFGVIWKELHPGQAGADAIDAQLHRERLAAPRPDAGVGDLPDGAFVLLAGEPWLVRGAALRRWTPAGYADSRPRAQVARAPLVTPPSLVEVLQAGWEGAVPLLHPTAGV
jgi:hypothetical protein